jgi:hypothetical protein
MLMHPRTRLSIALVGATLAVGLLAGPASAGEITPSGYIHGDDASVLPARSSCAYSGLNDGHYIADVDGYPEAERVQSWGQIPKEARSFLTGIGLAPGTACRP